MKVRIAVARYFPLYRMVLHFRNTLMKCAIWVMLKMYENMQKYCEMITLTCFSTDKMVSMVTGAEVTSFYIITFLVTPSIIDVTFIDI